MGTPKTKKRVGIFTKTKKMAETKEVAPEQALEVVNENGKVVSAADLSAQLDSAEVGREIGSDYFTLEPGEDKRLLFTEMTEMNGMGEQEGTMIAAARFFDPKDGKYKINADKVIVSACRALAAKGRKNVAISIVCTGMVKSARGFKYKEFKINELLIG